VDGWPRAGDLGIVAVDSAAGAAVGPTSDPGLHRAPGSGHQTSDPPAGAAWARLFPPDEPGYGFVAADVPELALAVTPARRGRGVGRTLLRALVAEARDQGHQALSLNVEDGNRARALYDQLGFVPVGREDASDVLLLRLTPG
jgi:GNAT superfamily N-acetyltransferase